MLIISGIGSGTTVMVGIVVRNPMITAIKLTHLSDKHCVCVELVGTFGRIYLASISFQCSDIVNPYIWKIDKIMVALQGKR